MTDFLFICLFILVNCYFKLNWFLLCFTAKVHIWLVETRKEYHYDVTVTLIGVFFPNRNQYVNKEVDKNASWYKDWWIKFVWLSNSLTLNCCLLWHLNKRFNTVLSLTLILCNSFSPLYFNSTPTVVFLMPGFKAQRQTLFLFFCHRVLRPRKVIAF